MNISQLADMVIEFFADVMKQKCRILSIMPKESEWEVMCEVNIDPDYTTSRGLGDLVEIYQVHIKNSMEIMDFNLKETKRKANLSEE
ncbi:MAG: hypothetical protein WCD89_21800 [Anaerocolumna sp.]